MTGFIEWNRQHYTIMVTALIFFGILLVFLLKGPFTRKFDPEFRDLVDPDHCEGIYAPFERLAFYMRGIAFPNFLTKKHFGKKNIKSAASYWDRFLAYVFYAIGFTFISYCLSFYIERLEIADLGLGHYGQAGRSKYGGGLLALVMDPFLDYLTWVIHSPPAAIAHTVAIFILIIFRRSKKRKVKK